MDALLTDSDRCYVDTVIDAVLTVMDTVMDSSQSDDYGCHVDIWGHHVDRQLWMPCCCPQSPSFFGTMVGARLS